MNDTIDKLKVYLLCKYAEDNSLYDSWRNELRFEVVIVDQCPVDFHPPEDCGIVITHEHYRWEEFSALRRIYEQRRFPTLILADGILEFRNTWKNPTIPDGSLYQPLMADKIACIGNSSARLIESWGNHGKVEVVGLPRLDPILQTQTSEESGENFRLVVATANTPAFDEDQRETVIRSLVALKNALDSAMKDNKALSVDWHLSGGLETQLGIASKPDSNSLLESIKSSSAVITTPSTIYLESALLNKPTAILDFSNSPQFIQSAWLISSSEQIEAVLAELFCPSYPKLHFQNYVLKDSLRCDSPATARMNELITSMIKIGAKCRRNHENLKFPNRILSHQQFENQVPDLKQAFPGNASFSIQDVNRLQAELSQSVHRLGALPRELSEKNSQISQLQTALDESRRRVADVRARLFKLRKILGIGKENQTEEVIEKETTE